VKRAYLVSVSVCSFAGLAAVTWAADPQANWSVRPAELLVAADAPLAMRLVRPTDGEAGDWRAVRFADCFVQAGGSKRKLEPAVDETDPSRVFLSPVMDSPGLVCVAIGSPADAGRPDAWRRADYCAKLLVSPVDGRGGPQNPLATVKVGHPIEIRALADPSQLVVGDDLAVRLYVDGSKVAGGAVHALVTSADGRSSRVEPLRAADSKGIAWFRLIAAGRWTVRFEHTVVDADGTRRKLVADLVFDIGKGVGR
jgi:hypothetical protein